MRENVRLMLKNNESDIINEFQSLIFIAKEEIQDKNFYEIKSSMLILLNKLAKKNI